MKRIFVILSNLLVSLFLVWVVSIWADTYASFYYPHVSIHNASSQASYDHISQRLTQLAEETDSLIAMQHQQPDQNGKPYFTYTIFGKGELPEGLIEKKIDQSSHISVETNYFIFDGNLKIERLSTELNQLGLIKLYQVTPSLLNSLIAVFGNGFQLISLLVYFLTFGALSLINQIKNMRTAGIRIISGEHRWAIFLRPINQDVINSMLGLLAGLILSVILKQLMPFPIISFTTIIIGLLFYNLILLAIALIFSGIFALGAKKVHLMQIIKGQMPVKGLISLILICQLVAMIVVSMAIRGTILYNKAYQQQNQGEAAWYKERDLMILSTNGIGINPREDKAEIERKNKIWFDFINQAVLEQRAFLSHHNLIHRVFQNGLNSADNLTASTIWNDYSPDGNVLIVTPGYLTHQQIHVSPEITDKINDLETGEFVLLLPHTLSLEEQDYKKTFEDYLTKSLAGGRETQQTMSGTVSYLENGHDRFIYNSTPLAYQQFLRDPIIVVLTPKSAGVQSVDFWTSAITHYFYFESLSEAQHLIQAHDIENWIVELESGYTIHLTLLKNIQTAVRGMLAGAILGVLTSILMFNTMNKLYFEQFRREIFIKRISGLRFSEIHRKYLMAQILILMIGFVASVLLGIDLLISGPVWMIFITISIVQLHLQMKKENEKAMLILKGA